MKRIKFFIFGIFFFAKIVHAQTVQFIEVPGRPITTEELNSDTIRRSLNLAATAPRAFGQPTPGPLDGGVDIGTMAANKAADTAKAAVGLAPGTDCMTYYPDPTFVCLDLRVLSCSHPYKLNYIHPMGFPGPGYTQLTCIRVYGVPVLSLWYSPGHNYRLPVSKVEVVRQRNYSSLIPKLAYSLNQSALEALPMSVINRNLVTNEALDRVKSQLQISGLPVPAAGQEAAQARQTAIADLSKLSEMTPIPGSNQTAPAAKEFQVGLSGEMTGRSAVYHVLPEEAGRKFPYQKKHFQER